MSLRGRVVESVGRVVESVGRTPRERRRVRSRSAPGPRHGDGAHRDPPSVRERRVGRRSGTSGASRSPSAGGGLGRRGLSVAVDSVVVVRVVGTIGAPASSVIGMRPGIVRREVSEVRRSVVVRSVADRSVVVRSVVRVVGSSVGVVSLGVVIGSCGRLRRSSSDRAVGGSGCCVSAYGYCHCTRYVRMVGNKHND